MDPRPEAYLFKENAQRRRLRRKTNKIVNFPLERLSQPCKFFYQIHHHFFKYNRRLRTAPGSPKTVSSSSPSVFWILSSTSIFLLLSHRFSFQVHKTCWKSPPLNRRFLSFFGKNEFGALILSVFEKKKLVFGLWKNQKTIVTSFFRCIFDRQDVSW